MIFLLLGSLTGFFIYFSKTYTITYAGSSSLWYNFYLYALLTGLLLLFYLLTKYLKAKITPQNNINWVLQLVYVIYGVIGLYIIIYILILLHRVNTYAGRVFEYGNIVVSKVLTLSEKLNLVQELKNAMALPTKYFEHLDFSKINCKQDIVEQVKHNLNSTIKQLSDSNNLIEQNVWFNNTTEALSKHSVIICSILGILLLAIVVPKIYSYLTPDLTFGLLLKQTFNKIASGFSQVDLLFDSASVFAKTHLAVATHLRTLSTALSNHAELTSQTFITTLEAIEKLEVGQLTLSQTSVNLIKSVSELKDSVALIKDLGQTFIPNIPPV